MKVKARLHSKALNIKELRQDNGYSIEWYSVSKVIEVDAAEYSHFRQGLLVSREWLEGVYKTGKVVVVKSSTGIEMIAVDTQGYDYARYAGVVVETK